MRLRLGLALANLGTECFKRPRGGPAGWYLQMIGHGVIGNGWWFRDEDDR